MKHMNINVKQEKLRKNPDIPRGTPRPAWSSPIGPIEPIGPTHTVWLQ